MVFCYGLKIQASVFGRKWGGNSAQKQAKQGESCAGRLKIQTNPDTRKDFIRGCLKSRRFFAPGDPQFTPAFSRMGLKF